MLVKLKLYYFKLPSNSTNRLYCFDSQMMKMKFKTLKKKLAYSHTNSKCQV